ncbi:MAG: efflux RND transporter permease subunit [Acidobacteriota bacterium]
MGSFSPGRLAVRHAGAITFICLALCAAGVYSALDMPSAVFPRTDFPRVVILVDNGVMPADEMMARITRPIEESMKDIPDSVTIRSSTGRGSAEVNVFFSWRADMPRSELYVLSRLSQIRGQLPDTASTSVFRLTFSAFPIIGVSLTGTGVDLTRLWEIARYDIKPRLLRIPGVARVDLVGGRRPEYHVVVDPLRLQSAGVSLAQVNASLARNNLIIPTGVHDEDHTMFLAVVDGRAHTTREIEELPVATVGTHLVRIRDVAHVERGPEPVFNIVSADGEEAVLLNVRSQPDGSTLDIARALARERDRLARELPGGLRTALFYDQSQLVRASVRSVWEAIGFGLLLSVAILFLFLKSWKSTLTATLVIPATVLVTLVAMRLASLSFNLMTLGGIAAAIGLVIDDAIVVVEAVHARIMSGATGAVAIEQGIGEIVRPLIGSTLTPVVVFIPLAFLGGITGVFFRALALTMVVSRRPAQATSLQGFERLGVEHLPPIKTLESSLEMVLCPAHEMVLAVTLTPSVATVFLGQGKRHKTQDGGAVLGFLIRVYERAMRIALVRPSLSVAGGGILLVCGLLLYPTLPREFLPAMDEGGFVIDYFTPWGTSLEDTNRQLERAEQILRATPEMESYSRRTGARLALAIAEPNTGDFLVKLRADRERSTGEVIAGLRRAFNAQVPGIQWEFPGILSDLIGDLTWAPQPIEVKFYSADTSLLESMAPHIEEQIAAVDGVVDTFDGLVYAGPTLSFRPRSKDLERFGLTANDLGRALNTAMLGEVTSSVVNGDRVVEVRVLVDPARTDRVATLRALPLRTPGGAIVKVSQVADVVEVPGQLELRREDLRQDVAITARLEGRDLGSAMAEIRDRLGRDPSIPASALEYGGLYEQQRESFQNLKHYF